MISTHLVSQTTASKLQHGHVIRVLMQGEAQWVRVVACVSLSSQLVRLTLTSLEGDGITHSLNYLKDEPISIQAEQLNRLSPELAHDSIH